MTAAALSRPKAGAQGLRRVDPRRDMAGIAELVEIAFAGSLDPTGRRMVQDMRLFGRAGWPGWLLGRLLLPPAAYPEGFVWVEAGRVVGNASLLPVEGHPRRWVMANVAVHPEYRRRGIARAMALAGVDWARQRRANIVILQVQRDNREALGLYTGLGFRTLCTRATWARQPGAETCPPPAAAPVRRRRPEEWVGQWDLARRLHPEGLVWPFPLEAGVFRPAAFGLDTTRHWVWEEGGRLLASVTAQPWTARAAWRLVMISEFEARGRVEAGLISRALHDLPSRTGVSLDYPADSGQAALEACGFRTQHTLTWMAFDLGNEERLDEEGGR